MDTTKLSDIFTEDKLVELFPITRANDFFEAMFGDADEGAYDIALGFTGQDSGKLNFELKLTPRPGKCLACNLTTGLPHVFERHPVINLKGLARDVESILGLDSGSTNVTVGRTRQVDRDLHIVPVVIG